MHQDAGSAACLQLQPCPVQRAEIPFLEEAAQAAGAEGVSARCVEGLHQRLQADVAHKVVVHLQAVIIKVVLPAAVDLATLWTRGLQGRLRGLDYVYVAAGAAHRFSFSAAQLWHKWLQLGCRYGKGRTLLSHRPQTLNRLQRGQKPSSGWWHIALQVKGHSRNVQQLFQENECLIICWRNYSCGKCLVHVFALSACVRESLSRLCIAAPVR